MHVSKCGKFVKILKMGDNCLLKPVKIGFDTEKNTFTTIDAGKIDIAEFIQLYVQDDDAIHTEFNKMIDTFLADLSELEELEEK